MPTIVAMCPYCRAGGVRAPESAVGASATCPKCKSSFTVMPSEGLPGWAREGNDPRGTNAPAPPPAATVETRPAAVLGMADVTEPSPLLPANDQQPAAESPVREAAPDTTEEPAGEPVDLGLVVGLVALILVGAAVVGSQFPYGRYIAVGMAVVGILGGVAALGAESRGRLAGCAAIALHAIVLIVVLLLPSWLSLDSWRGAATEDEVPKSPMVLDHQGGLSRPLAAGEWIDAAASSWQYRDLRVTVRSASLGPVELTGPKEAKRKTRESYLHLRLRVANSGVARDIPLLGWAAGQSADGVRVTDPNGKALRLATFDDGWRPDRGKPTDRLFPAQASEVNLLLAAPQGKVEWLRVQLSGSAVGLPDEEIRFQVNGAMLGRNAAP